MLLLVASTPPAALALGLAAVRRLAWAAGAATGVAQAAGAASRSSADGAGRGMAGLLGRLPPNRSAACGVCARRVASIAPAPPRTACGELLGRSAIGAIKSGGGGAGMGIGAAGPALAPGGASMRDAGAAAGPGVALLGRPFGLLGRPSGLPARATAPSLLA